MATKQITGSEQDLIESAAQGDSQAFTELFERHFQAVYNYAVSLTRDQAAAEDLTQDAFIKAHANLRRIGPPWKFRAWIFRLEHNLFLDQLKRRQTVNLDPSRQPADREATDLEETSIRRANAEQVQRALRALPDQQREALVLRDIYAFAYVEIAEIMALSLSNVRVTLHRARIRFQESYGLRLLLDEPTPDCAALYQLLTLAHDGEPLGGEAGFVNDHLKSCAACRERSRRLAEVSGMLGMIVALIPPSGLGQQILDKVGIKGGPASPQSSPQPPATTGGSPLRGTTRTLTAIAIVGVIFLIGAIGRVVYVDYCASARAAGRMSLFCNLAAQTDTPGSMPRQGPAGSTKDSPAAAKKFTATPTVTATATPTPTNTRRPPDPPTKTRRPRPRPPTATAIPPPIP